MGILPAIGVKQTAEPCGITVVSLVLTGYGKIIQRQCEEGSSLILEVISLMKNPHLAQVCIIANQSAAAYLCYCKGLINSGTRLVRTKTNPPYLRQQHEWYPFVLSLGSYAVFWLLFYFLYKKKIFIKV